VEICINATLEIIHISNKSLQDMGKKRDDREIVRIELADEGVARSRGKEVISFP
jgi:hypothetical protein